MKKTDKKIENKLRNVLTEVCEIALENVSGYQWISHQVNYDAFPSSLLITFAFDSQQAIDDLKRSQQDGSLQKTIIEKLASVDIKLKDVRKQVKFVVK